MPEMNHAVTCTGFAVSLWLLLVGLYGIVTSRHLVHLCLCLAVVQASTYVLLVTIGYRPGLPAPVFTDHVNVNSLTVDPVIQGGSTLTDVVVEATVVALFFRDHRKIQQCTGETDPNYINVMRG